MNHQSSRIPQMLFLALLTCQASLPMVVLVQSAAGGRLVSKSASTNFDDNDFVSGKQRAAGASATGSHSDDQFKFFPVSNIQLSDNLRNLISVIDSRAPPLASSAVSTDRYKNVGILLNNIDDDHQDIDLHKLNNQYRYDLEFPLPQIQARRLAFDEYNGLRSNRQLSAVNNNNNIGAQGVYVDSNYLEGRLRSAPYDKDLASISNYVQAPSRSLASFSGEGQLGHRLRDQRSNEDNSRQNDISKEFSAELVSLSPRLQANDFIRSPLPKRAKCHGGLAHDCDVKDFLSVMSNRRFWESPTSPGR